MTAEPGGAPAPSAAVSAPRPPFTIVLPQHWTPAETVAQTERGETPAHIMLQLADDLGGRVITAADIRPGRVDQVLGLVVGSRESWALARLATRQRGPDDIYYASSEEVGIAISFLQAVRRRSTRRVGFYLMVPDGRRIRWMLRLIRLLRFDPMVVTTTPNTYDGAERYLKRHGRRIALLRSPLDLDFFTPTRRNDNARPLLASAGLERRDYATLLKAMEGLDADLVVCAISQNATQSSSAFPESIPSNARFEPLSMAELRDLYQRADATIVACLPNTIDAGTTVALEAAACGSPLLVTHTSGLLDWATRGIAADAGVGDPDAMRAAIERVINDREASTQMAHRALEHVRTANAAAVFHDRFVQLVHAALTD